MKDNPRSRATSWMVVITLSFIFIAGCAGGLEFGLSDNDGQVLMASGIVEAREISVASETGGKVSTVLVAEGDRVQAGDLLFALDTSTTDAQRRQAAAELDTARAGLRAARATLAGAEAGLDVAQIGVELAELGYQQAVQAARMEEAPHRVEDWDQDLPAEFELPAWYFYRDELQAAAEEELEEAKEDLHAQEERHQDLIDKTGDGDLAAAKKRLAEAQIAFFNAQELLNHNVGFEGSQDIRDYRQSIFDAAEEELDAAQEAYQVLLSEEEADDIQKSRAQISVARERYQLAQDRVQSFYTGEDARQVQQAQLALRQARANRDQAGARVDQAQAGIDQAERTVQQAERALEAMDVTLEKFEIKAPADGVVLTQSINPGEVVQPGVTAITLGRLDQLSVTVYIPEDEYGRISLGDRAQLSVDSFPDQTFDARVVRIADQAEYTPRNVQTKEERQKTVFAVELSVVDGRGKLKPGMPTDVTFTGAE